MKDKIGRLIIAGETLPSVTFYSLENKEYLRMKTGSATVDGFIIAVGEDNRLVVIKTPEITEDTLWLSDTLETADFKEWEILADTAGVYTASLQVDWYEDSSPNGHDFDSELDFTNLKKLNIEEQQQNDD